jgi:hypothetical protein
MRAGEINEALRMFDLLLEYFGDGVRWTRGRYRDGHGRHYLIGAIYYLHLKHRIARGRRCIFFGKRSLAGHLGLSISMITAAAVSPSCAWSSSRPALSRLGKRNGSGPRLQSSDGCRRRLIGADWVDADQEAGLAQSAIGRRAVLGNPVEVRLVTLIRASAAVHVVSTVRARSAATVKK